MTREKTRGVIFDTQFNMPEDIPDYLGLMGREADNGFIDKQLMKEWIQNLGSAVSDPNQRSYLVLRRWRHSPETAPRDEITSRLPFGLEIESQREMLVDPDELPRDTCRLIDRIYELTGANILRDDTDGGTEHGFIIRSGTYDGKRIYFREIYGDMPKTSPYHNALLYTNLDPSQRSVGIEVMGEARGEIALEELSPADISRLSSFVDNRILESYTSTRSGGKPDRMPAIHRSNLTEIEDLLFRAASRAHSRALRNREKQQPMNRLKRALGELVSGRARQDVKI